MARLCLQAVPSICLAAARPLRSSWGMVRRHKLSDETWALIETSLPQRKEPALLSRSDDPQRHAFPLPRARRGGHLPERYGPGEAFYSRFARWQARRPVGADARHVARAPRCRRPRRPGAGRSPRSGRDIEEVISAPWHLDGSNVRAHKRAAGAGENSPPPLRARRARRLDHGRSPGRFGTKLRAWRPRAAGCRTARARFGAPAHRGDDSRDHGPVRARAPR